MINNTDYQIAWQCVHNMKENEKRLVEVGHVGNFRKYLREIVVKQGTVQRFATRIENDKIRVIRID